jgi:signal transduction histidine kinase
MADASFSALLALASHELRQPTGIVRGYLSMLESDLTLAARARNVIDEAARGADKIVALLDEMGELARLRDGSFRPALKSTSLRSVLNQAVQAAKLPLRPSTFECAWTRRACARRSARSSPCWPVPRPAQ